MTYSKILHCRLFSGGLRGWIVKLAGYIMLAVFFGWGSFGSRFVELVVLVVLGLGFGFHGWQTGLA
jgi:hypothetical protein